MGTATETNPWWSLHMGSIFNVTRVRVLNRADCCAERLMRLEVWLTDGSATSYSSGTRCAARPRLSSKTSFVSLPCEGSGSKIWFVLPGFNQVLTLCAVDIQTAK